MALEFAKSQLLAAFAGFALAGGTMLAAEPQHSAEQTLRDPAAQPKQKDVQYDRPEGAEIAKCTIKSEGQGYTVRDANGLVLRKFLDVNSDGTVDQFCFFKDGIEVYREIDSDFNNKVDQYRWLNTAGVRWGIDKDENGVIDTWRAISAEEVTAELVAALKSKDRARFERLLLTRKELASLGLGKAKSDLVAKKLEAATASFMTLANKKGVMAADTKWTSFGGTQPGMVPAGTDDSTADLVVYENVATVVETAGKPQALTVGTMIRVGDAWRLIDAPQVMEDNANDSDGRMVFFAPQRGERSDVPGGQPNERMQALIKELDKLRENDHDRRAELLETLAKESDTQEARVAWYRQLAETLNAAVLNGQYPGGIARLKSLHEKLDTDPKDQELAFYVQYRWMTAEHGQALVADKADYARIQTKWVDDLEKFVAAARKYPETAEAMLELAISHEAGGDDEKALQWYYATVKDFPQSPLAKKAAGARLRLDSEGKSIPLAGKTIDGKASIDLKSNLKGKTVLIQYWATWSDSKTILPMLKELYGKYQKSGFEIVGVCLDNTKEEGLKFLSQNKTPWQNLFEPGGMDGRFANDLGINTLPLMILVDKQGKVINRNIRASDLETELQKALK